MRDVRDQKGRGMRIRSIRFELGCLRRGRRERGRLELDHVPNLIDKGRVPVSVLAKMSYEVVCVVQGSESDLDAPGAREGEVELGCPDGLDLGGLLEEEDAILSRLKVQQREIRKSDANSAR